MALLLATGLLALTLPSGPIFWLPLVALVPFFMALRGLKPAAGFILGWAGGSLFWLVSTLWIFNACRELMDWSVPAAFIASLFFFLYQGLPYGLAGLVCGMTNKAGRGAGPFFAAGIFTLFIALWPALCPGSPAISLYSWPQAIQIADIGGMPLVFFFMLLADALLAEVIIPSPFKRRIRYSVLFILLISVVLGYGSLRLNHLKTLEAAHPESRISVRTIQPNILSKGSSGSSNNQIQLSSHPALRRITEESALNSTPADLILWPEAPGSPSCDNLHLQALAEINQSPLLFSCTEYHYRVKKQEPVIGPDGSEMATSTDFPLRELSKMYNSLALVADGQITGVYRKTRLVPFGEATPFSERWPLLRKYLGKRHEYKPGPGPNLLVLPGGLRVQPLICFESGFPDISRTGAAMGADAFVTVANDGWFGHKKAAELHLGLALFRAVEQRRPMIRATNTGMGAHIHATGEIANGTLTPMDQVTFRQASLFVPTVLTPYQLMGNNWLAVLALMLVVIYFSSRWRKTASKTVACALVIACALVLTAVTPALADENYACRVVLSDANTPGFVLKNPGPSNPTDLQVTAPNESVVVQALMVG